MSDLLEHILSEDYVSACKLFEERLNNIVEKKLYEMKQDIQAEAFGALSKADIEARRKAGYRKASEVLDDPYDRPMTMIGKEKSTETKSKPRRKVKLKLKEDSPPPASAAALANVNRIANLRRASEFLQNKQNQDDRSPSGGELKQVKPEVVKSFINRDSLKGRRDRLLTKAKELDKRGSGAVNRASRVKGAYYSIKAKKAGAEKIGKYIGGAAKSILQGFGEENT